MHKAFVVLGFAVECSIAVLVVQSTLVYVSLTLEAQQQLLVVVLLQQYVG
jgi:hypothetical protein